MFISIKNCWILIFYDSEINSDHNLFFRKKKKKNFSTPNESGSLDNSLDNTSGESSDSQGFRMDNYPIKHGPKVCKLKPKFECEFCGHRFRGEYFHKHIVKECLTVQLKREHAFQNEIHVLRVKNKYQPLTIANSWEIATDTINTTNVRKNSKQMKKNMKKRRKRDKHSTNENYLPNVRYTNG